MSIKERFQRFVSRKSLSSGHSSSSSSSNSDTCDTPPMPYASSSGTSTPISTTAHPPAAINPSPQDISTSLSNKTSPTSTSFLSKTLTWRSSHGEASSSSPSSSAATATGTAKKERTKWGSGRKDRRNATAATGSAGAAARRRVHPSERPLTEANLRQQEALSAFKWEFGRSAGRRGSLGGWSVESGISPCCSRRPSLVPPPVA